jgi:hypothetical protein
MIAPISPTTAIPKMLVRDVTMVRFSLRGGTGRFYRTTALEVTLCALLFPSF